MRGPLLIALLTLGACNKDPGESPYGPAYRDPLDDGPTSGERGSIKITEVLWTGSMTDDGKLDKTDLFLELRNESARPMDLTGWQIDIASGRFRTFRLPDIGRKVDVGEHIFYATKSSGCFPEPDGLIPDFALQFGDGFELTLKDFDDRLIEPIGSEKRDVFAGAWDGELVRSMERIELMFGPNGSEPQAWHHAVEKAVDIPNNDRIAEGCRERTIATPGRANSPDYSGAIASGSLD